MNSSTSRNGTPLGRKCPDAERPRDSSTSRNGTPLGRLIIIDYLQLNSSTSRNGTPLGQAPGQPPLHSNYSTSRNGAPLGRLPKMNRFGLDSSTSMNDARTGVPRGVQDEILGERTDKRRRSDLLSFAIFFLRVMTRSSAFISVPMPWLLVLLYRCGITYMSTVV